MSIQELESVFLMRNFPLRIIYGFLDNGMVYTTPGLLAPNGMHLSQRRKGVFVQELPGLISRTLNQIPRRKIDKTRPSW